MISLIKSDIYKLLKSKSVLIILVISIISAIIVSTCSHMIAIGYMKIENTSGILALFAEQQMMALLGSVIAGAFISSDFENKIIENAISSGHPRISIIISKVITLCIVTLLIYLPYLIATVVLSFTQIEFNNYLNTPMLNILAKLGNHAMTTSLFGNMIEILFTSLIIYIAQLSISIFFMFLLRKPVLVMASTYISILILGPIVHLNNTLKNIMSYTPFGIDFSNFTLITHNTIFSKSIIVSIIFIIIIIILTYLIFRKSEVK